MLKDNKYFQLFITTFLISASTSGGYAIVSMMKDKFVNKLKWVEEDEMVDLLAIAQSSPGPIAINTSILVGYKVAGFLGAMVTMAGTVLPPLVIMCIVASCYNLIADNQILRYIMKGMAAGVAALLLSITIDLFKNLTKQKSILSYILLVIAFIVARYTNISYFFIALLCGGTGLIKVLIMNKKGGKK